MWSMLRDLATDLRFALRMMRKSAFASATIILCLGFSIGATGTVFAWTRSIVFTPVPGVVDPEGLVSFRTVTSRGDANVAYATYQDIRDAESARPTRILDAIGATSVRRFSLRTDPGADTRLAEPIWGSLVSANYFEVLGVQPVIGRGFLASEDSTGGAAAVVVISHGLWERRFASDPDVRGRRIRVNNRELTIVGVAPKGFIGTVSRLAMDLWIPLVMQPELGGSRDLLALRSVRWIDAFGRLAPGVSLAAANAAARQTGVRLSERYAELKDLGLRARTFDVGPVERMAQIFAVLLGLSILVVLIVCSNVANLLLLRGAAREHELAVRLALGAGRGRVVRQLMTECLLLALGGVAVAAGVAAWAKNALTSLAPASPLPIVATTEMSASVLAVIGSVGIATIFAFGLAPALRSTRISVRASLTGGGTRGGTAQGSRLRGALVSAQFALSLAVLATAGLFLHRLDEIQRVDRGFRDAEQVLLATVDFGLAGVATDSMRHLLTERIVSQLAALPGVRAASAATFVPLGFLGYQSRTVRIDGYAPQPGEPMTFLINSIAAGYFDTMGIPVEAGRPIDLRDRAGAERVAVVNETFAQRFFGSGSAVGRRIHLDNDELTIVGVVADGKYEFLVPLDQPSPPFIYVPFAQWSNSTVVMHVRTTGNPLAMVGAVSRTVAEADSRLTAMSPSTLEAYSSVPYLPIRLASRVLTALGIAALILATLGLYSVIAYAVAQQAREIGIRMALGATPKRLVNHFLSYAARYAGVGAVAGTLLAVFIARFLAARIPGSVSPEVGDRVVPFSLAVLTLGVVAVVAALIPANRAARVSPTVALREE